MNSLKMISLNICAHVHMHMHHCGRTAGKDVFIRERCYENQETNIPNIPLIVSSYIKQAVSLMYEETYIAFSSHFLTARAIILNNV